MTRYEITVTVPTIGKVKHVIRAADRKAAIARVKRAHPHAARISAERLPEAPPPDYTARARNVLTEAARQASNAAKSRRHAKHLQALHDALTPEGEGVTALAARLGVAAVSVRKWAAELEADGRAIREAVDAQGTLRIRRAKA